MFCIVEMGQPVVPWRGFRGVDPWGAGGFRAPRDGGQRLHMGCDILTLPGDSILAPIEGIISRVGLAKAGTELGSIHITGTGDYAGWHVKMFYVLHGQSVHAGDSVKKGTILGIAQDVAGFYHTAFPQRPKTMRNHIHIELRMNVDPARFFPTFEVKL